MTPDFTDNKDRFLPQWYSNADTIIGRHSSARQPYPNGGVCDYRLYDIRIEDANMLLFNTVWDLVLYPDLSDFFKNTDVIKPHLNIKNECVKKWHRLYLIFPSEKWTSVFDNYMQSLPYFIGVYYKRDYVRSLMTGEIEYVVNEPMFSNYLTPRWDLTRTDPEVAYRCHNKKIEWWLPRFYDNTSEFEHVVEEMVAFLLSVKTDVSLWIERLRTTRNMLNTHANELHILHNAGLYDINTLWNRLIDGGYDNEQFRTLRKSMEKELHRYAMMVVNLIDWKKGGVDKDRLMSRSESESDDRTREFILNNRAKPPAPESFCKKSGNNNIWDAAPPHYQHTGYVRNDADLGYTYPPADLNEPSYVRNILPEYWWNNIGAMEKAFQWTNDERRMLDEAYDEGTKGRGPFQDDLSKYVNLLRKMVERRLRKLAEEEYEAKHGR